MNKITGKDLINKGAEEGPWFPEAIKHGNDLIIEGAGFVEALDAALEFAPAPKMKLRDTGVTDIFMNIDEGDNEIEKENVRKVGETMQEVMRTPGIKGGAIMPDACPAGPLGTIPVGGVVASEYIHPGMHSADICCSVAISVLGNVDPKKVLDAVEAITHFGPGGRERGKQWGLSKDLSEQFAANEYLKTFRSLATEHMGTQGDGNHFAFVGTLKSTGQTALVTHHGSRAPGARLYKSGMRDAIKHTTKVADHVKKQNAWIDPDTREGEEYWSALQIIRQWTKENHYLIHDEAAKILKANVVDRFWNEHNFVFRKTDGLFYHAKGATPAFDSWAHDATELTLIPLNMAQPILIAKGSNADNGLGFSPHGAGRNTSRTFHKKSLDGMSDQDVFNSETKGIDARFFMKNIDVSELPSAYKDADTVRAQIDQYKLATIVDEVIPYGSIMAGDWERDAPWKKRRERKKSQSK